MSDFRWNGRYHAGAMREYRERKRLEAEARMRKYRERKRLEAEARMPKPEPVVLTPEQRKRSRKRRRKASNNK